MCKYCIYMSESFDEFLEKIYKPISIFNKNKYFHKFNDIEIFWNNTYILDKNIEYQDFLMTHSFNRSGVYELPLSFQKNTNDKVLKNQSKNFHMWLSGKNILKSNHILLSENVIQISSLFQSIDQNVPKILLLISNNNVFSNEVISLKNFYILMFQNNNEKIKVYNNSGNVFLENIIDVLDNYNVLTGTVTCDNGEKYFVDQNQIKKYTQFTNHIDSLENCLMVTEKNEIKIIDTIELLKYYDCFNFPYFELEEKYRVMKNNEDKIITLINIKNDLNKILTISETGKIFCFDLIDIYYIIELYESNENNFYYVIVNENKYFKKYIKIKKISIYKKNINLKNNKSFFFDQT